MRGRLLRLAGLLLLCPCFAGCESVGQPPSGGSPASAGVQDTRDQERADLVKELSLYSD
jgi:hypothetical protein